MDGCSLSYDIVSTKYIRIILFDFYVRLRTCGATKRNDGKYAKQFSGKLVAEKEAYSLL